MAKKVIIFLAIFFGTIAVDQIIKQFILGGFRWDSQCISITLAFNKGVAFSMFAFLDEHLKFIQIALVIAAFAFSIYYKYFKEYYYALALLFAGGVSNIYDRFVEAGVVDYVYWHCGFDFAIFNYADVMIDLSIVLILWQFYILEKQRKGN